MSTNRCGSLAAGQFFNGAWVNHRATHHDGRKNLVGLDDSTTPYEFCNRMNWPAAGEDCLVCCHSQTIRVEMSADGPRDWSEGEANQQSSDDSGELHHSTI